MQRGTEYAIQTQGEFARFSAGGTSFEDAGHSDNVSRTTLGAGTDAEASTAGVLPSRCERYSITCPNCRTSVLDIPEDILEVEEDPNLSTSLPLPATAPDPRRRRWSRRSSVNWISRPLNRKASDASSRTVRSCPSPKSSTGLTPPSIQLTSPSPPLSPGELEKQPHSHERRISTCSENSDTSSQTKVDPEPTPAPKSILAHSPSVSSKASGRSGLTAKRSVKFSDEPVYYDYSYRDHLALKSGHCACCCTCSHYPSVCDSARTSASTDFYKPSVAPPAYEYEYDAPDFDPEAATLYGYDDDMFSFEEPASIPSAAHWSVLSRFIAWLRRATGRRRYTIDEEAWRPVISRPQPLAPRRTCAPYPTGMERERARSRRRVPMKRSAGSVSVSSRRTYAAV